jgi:hypothetical protein
MKKNKKRIFIKVRKIKRKLKNFYNILVLFKLHRRSIFSLRPKDFFKLMKRTLATDNAFSDYWYLSKFLLKKMHYRMRLYSKLIKLKEQKNNIQEQIYYNYIKQIYNA